MPFDPSLKSKKIQKVFYICTLKYHEILNWYFKYMWFLIQKKCYVYKKAIIGRFGEGKSFSLGRSSNRKKHFIKTTISWRTMVWPFEVGCISKVSERALTISRSNYRQYYFKYCYSGWNSKNTRITGWSTLTYRKSSSEVYIKWFMSRENTTIKHFTNFTL